MKKKYNKVVTFNFDNVKFRLPVGRPYFTAYYKDGHPPVKFDIFDDLMIDSFLSLAVEKGAAPSGPVMHKTKKNTFVWGGAFAPKDVVERYDAEGQRHIQNKLSTNHGKALARAILRAAVKKAA